MIKYPCMLLTAFMLLTGNFVVAQNTNSSVDETLNTFQKQVADFPSEKVYLQLDKPFYGAGDTIWFKAYAVIGAGHHLSGRSNVLNVELINGQNMIKRSIKLPLLGGISYGDFPISDTLADGNYRIRAYTNWMRNAGPEYFFDKTIAIVNAAGNKVFTKTTYSFSVNNGQQTVNATINYTDLEGNAYINKAVKYEIQLDPQQVAKGKGITDDKGDLHLTFINPAPGKLSTGQIITSIQLENQKTVTKVVAIKATDKRVDVQFFAESGVLVNNIRSKVAFKAMGADGLGADVKGTITDEQGNEIAQFNSTHLGMGAFILVPEPGKNYKAHLTYADGSTGVADLPKAVDKGYVMAIRTDSANVIVKISGAGYETQTGEVTLVAQSGGEIYLQGKGQAGKASFTAAIPKNKLPDGIVQFTLFSALGEPLNERLVFIQNTTPLKLNIRSEKEIYQARQKVKINLTATDKDNVPVQGNFSVSVTDETKVPVDENNESTILANLLLTSDIKGYIEQPNYYFEHPNEKTKADMDVLMLTQGYHRFEWKNIIGKMSPIAIYQPEKSIVISGRLKNTNGKYVSNSKVTLVNNLSGFSALDTVTDKNGRFVYNLDFKDSSRFTIKAAAFTRGDMSIELDNNMPAANINKNKADMQVSINDGLAAYLRNSKKLHDEEVKYGLGDHTVILKEVSINSRRPKTEKELKIEQAVEFSANLNGKGMADQVVTSEDLEGKGCATVGDCLAGKLLGVTFSPGGTAYSTRGNNTLRGKTPMMVVVDGVTSSGLNSINVDDIGAIEVLRSGQYTAIYGVRASGGVLIVTSKHGTGYVADTKNDPGNIYPQGYYISKQFYSPLYDNPKTNTQVADLRTTIFWKPIIQTDKNGNAFFEYFNAGSKGTYRIVIEGVAYSGSLGRQVYRYKVE